MTKHLAFSRPRNVVFVAFPGVQMLDLIGPLEIFAAANVLLRKKGRVDAAGYGIKVVSDDGHPVRASNGQLLDVQQSMRRPVGKIDTLVVPGAFELGTTPCDHRLVAWIRRNAPHARRVAAVCSGSFLLAEAGLLDGRKATTHWAGCERLQQRYPSVQVDPDPIFVRDGSIYTSAGVTAGMDLALALVEADLGREAALELARWFVMFLKRPGGQAQFSTHLQTQFLGSPPLQPLLGWIAEHPAGDLSVEALARRASLSPRHFARTFRREVGVTPGVHILRVRLECARRELEDAPQALKAVASRSGFGTEESLRRAFRDHLGVTPGEYRRRFRRERTVGES